MAERVVYRLAGGVAALLGLAAPGALAELTYDEVAAGFDFAVVGDVGNPAYASDAFHILATVGRGSVDYRFRITRSEISAGQYFEFYDTFSRVSDELEARLDANRWWVSTDPGYDGPGKSRLLATFNNPYAERGVVQTEREQGLMYANWLHNGKSDDPADLFRGAYNFDPVTGEAPDTHEPGARFRLPTVDEYLKAAYYDPDKNGEGPGWWQYPHASDEPPVPGPPSSGDFEYGADFGEVLAELPGLPSDIDVPLYAYERAQSPWGLTDLTNGTFAEYLGEREFIYALPGLNDAFGPEVWSFEVPEFTPALRDMSAVLDDGGFRIVTVVPAPGVGVLMFGVGGLCVVRRGRGGGGGH